jgi:hypothetical protein
MKHDFALFFQSSDKVIARRSENECQNLVREATVHSDKMTYQQDKNLNSSDCLASNQCVVILVLKSFKSESKNSRRVKILEGFNSSIYH